MSTETHAQRPWLAHLRHELGTPINTIIGYSELLLENLEDRETAEKQQLLEDLERIRHSGNHLLSLVRKILDPAKLEISPSKQWSETIGEELRAELETPAKSAIGYAEKLLAIASADIIPDLEKIRQAARQLLGMMDEAVNQFKQQMQLEEVKQVETLDLPPQLVLDEDGTPANTPSALLFNSYWEKDNNEQQLPHQGYILVVDDNENNRDLLCRHLQDQNYRVAVATNGRQALQTIQTQQYDLILLDVIMPEMNGYQVLQWLRESQWRRIPAIMISALDELDSVVKCIEMGAEDYLPKPFNPTLLRARIGACLEKKRLRDQEALYATKLAQANQEITILNERLKAENLRLSAELEVTRRLQQMILPKEEELSQIKELDIAGYMQPADEVGGDYYDVLQHKGRIKIGIGDVTGHGLESGVLMIMLQTAVRTLMENEQTDPIEFLETINRTIYKNVQRMNSDKNLTLSLVDYEEGILNLSGQHEEMIVVRSSGSLERISTIDLGFPIGLEESIADFITQTQVKLNPGDVAVLYTDGITEAENESGVQYGIERLCEIVRQNWHKSASEIRQIVIEDVRQHIGKQKVYDDITLLVLKQKFLEQSSK